ncbi:YcnI family protein [Actinoplanes sp. TBRC 11911]|uniref:YcnI family protein n=1 Tax=Actinoplanes sp. TBRC 11911 TaxID=2729386 RepID=UPI00145F28BB|nr:YcnI family protein [Actinoplanes sp. TBRC 11911]NMO51566.1 YcnI family protein [Actinoplanes sp. TBRC 11911]
MLQLKRTALVAATVAGLTLAVAAPAAAHVTVNPSTAAPGGFTKATFRVPNESDTASTTKLELNLPPIAFVSLKPVAGWAATPVKTKLDKPLEAHGSQITEAITKITWTAQPGSEIKPGTFQEFDVSLGPLPESGQLVFKALQTYSDGAVVRWIDEPTTDGTEPEHPAPVLKLAAAPAADAPAAVQPAAAPAADDSGSSSNGLGIAGLAAGILALLIAAAAYARAGRRPAAVTGASAAEEAEKESATRS